MNQIMIKKSSTIELFGCFRLSNLETACEWFSCLRLTLIYSKLITLLMNASYYRPASSGFTVLRNRSQWSWSAMRLKSLSLVYCIDVQGQAVYDMGHRTFSRVVPWDPGTPGVVKLLVWVHILQNDWHLSSGATLLGIYWTPPHASSIPR